jgi:hypothetical protein
MGNVRPAGTVRCGRRAAQDLLYHAAHLGVRVPSERIQERPKVQPACRGRGEDDPATNAGIGVGDSPTYVWFEAGRLVLEELTERLVCGRPHPRLGSDQPGADRVERFGLAAPAETKERVDAGLRIVTGCKR